MKAATYRSVFKNAAYIFFIKLFPYVAIFFITILYSRKLPVAAYGNYQDFWIKLLLLGTVAYAGIPVTLLTYAPDVIRSLYRQLSRKQTGIYICWLICWGVFFAWLEGYTLQLPALTCFVLLCCYALHSVQESLLMAAKKMNGLLLFNAAYAFYFIGIHIAALSHYDLPHLLFLLMIGMVLRAAGLTWVVYSVYRKQGVAVLDQDILTKARSLWLHLGFYDLLQNLFRYLDKFILSLVLTAPLYALYFNGAQDIPLLPYLLGAVSGSVLLQLADNKEKEYPHLMMQASARLLSCIVFPLFFFLFFFSHELFHVVFTSRFAGSVPIFMATLLVLPLRAYNYTVLLQHRHQGALINKGALLDIAVALALIYPMYRLMGLPGVALSFVISTYIQVAYYVYHTTRLLQVTVGDLFPFRNWTWKFLLSWAVFLGVHYMLRSTWTPLPVFISGAVALLLLSTGLLAYEYHNRKS